jgi:hypothetical protein
MFDSVARADEMHNVDRDMAKDDARPGRRASSTTDARTSAPGAARPGPPVVFVASRHRNSSEMAARPGEWDNAERFSSI